MDPGTILAIVTETISLTKSAIRYIKDVKDADEDRSRLRNEAQLLLLPLVDLEDMVVDAKTNSNWPLITCLVNVAPTLQQFRKQMELLVQKLMPDPSKGKNLIQKLKWPFEKSEVNSILDSIERLKTLLLLVMEGNVSRVLSHMAKHISNMHEDLTMLKNTETARQLEETLNWLSPLDFSSRHQTLRDAREEGTRQWFLTSDTFQAWLCTPRTSLLCTGAPACGKTFLTSFVIDHLLPGKDISPVLYVYCSYKEQQLQSANNILGTLLKQLSRSSSLLQTRILQMHSVHLKANTRPSSNELYDLLHAGLAPFQTSYILIDALDELMTEDGSRDSTISWLMKLANCTNIMATSRPIQTVITSMKVTLTWPISAHEDDIRLYVFNRMINDQSLARKIGDDVLLKESILQSVLQRSQGVFLVAPLYMNALSDTVSKWQIREKLESFPITLDQMYMDTLMRIESQNSASADLACRVLIWLSCAMRPLTVRELQTAVAIEPGLERMDDERLSDEHTLTSVCGGLLTIEPQTTIVRLIHYTAQKYLDRLCNTKWPTAKLKIAELLLVYLSFQGLEIPPRHEINTQVDDFTRWRSEMYSTYPLLEYAAANLGSHLGLSGDIEETLLPLILSFSENRTKNHNILLFHGLMFCYPDLEKPVFMASSVHLFATLGLNTALRRYLAHNMLELNSTWPIGMTPLSLAVKRGHIKTTELLIHLGASTSSDPYPIHLVVKEKSYQMVYVVHLLHIAAMEDHVPLIDLLIAKGVAIDTWVGNSKYGEGTGTALHAATRVSNFAAVKALLRHGAKLNGFPSNALHTAVLGRNEEILKLLLDHGADVDARDDSGSTALFLSVALGRLSMVRLLLERGANISVVDNGGETALFKLVTLCMLPPEGRSDPVLLLELLIGYSANINIQDSQGWTILNHALGQLREDIKTPGVQALIGCLLNHGADLSLRDLKGMTISHHAAIIGEAQLLEGLLHSSADINAKDERGCTPLHYAAGHGHSLCVRCLLTNNAIVQIHDDNGRSPLHYAITKGSDECQLIVKQLVDMGASINAVDFNGQTALHVAANQGCIGIGQLLSRGADMDLQDKYSCTALMYAVHHGHCKLVDLFLSCHANSNIRTNRGRTALHFAANHGNVDILHALVKNGAELKAIDLEGNTALLYGARHFGTTQFLLEEGLTPAADLRQYTSLHRAARYGNAEVVRLLLRHGADSNMSKEAWEYGNMREASLEVFDVAHQQTRNYEEAIQTILICVAESQTQHGEAVSQPLPLRER